MIPFKAPTVAQIDTIISIITTSATAVGSAAVANMDIPLMTFTTNPQIAANLTNGASSIIKITIKTGI